MKQAPVFETAPAEMSDAETRQLLVNMLREAAKLEHSLLNTYLFAACSIRSTPAEFDDPAGHLNRRQAVQFERARGWKQRMLQVAQEEMRHLHYVQCLLRGLGEAPCFALPDVDPVTQNWVFPDWKVRLGLTKGTTGEAVEVPLLPFSVESCRRFVIYESTDGLQDANPFGPATSALFEKLLDFETELRLEGMLLPVKEDATRQTLKAQLKHVYTEMSPQPGAPTPGPGTPVLVQSPMPSPFQSIADLYLGGIEPLYNEAFNRQWVVNKNRDLLNELQNPDVAAEGFLPVGPIYRDQTFQQRASALDQHPLTHYKTVADIISEIVDEGEGLVNFEAKAAFLLKKVTQLGGGRAYWTAWLADKQAVGKPTPEWLQTCEDLRQSHLYRFAMILTELRQEEELARQAGLRFEPGRQPMPVAQQEGLQKLTRELPAQFNTCYLVMTMWLSRMYEVDEWASDMPERNTIEMLASWPLMSMAIRPFLELASLFPIRRTDLFRTNPDSFPAALVSARKLAHLVEAGTRSQVINDTMDELGLHLLTSVANWADDQRDVVQGADWPDHQRQLALTRLKGLTRLRELGKQFPFRVHGGYANKLPEPGFIRQHPNGSRFEEDPTRLKKLFADGFVLRIRFAGQGKAQLATDPDPPTDEVGSTGTNMLHPADGNRRLNRALVWQNTDPETTIQREPVARLPPTGVNVADVSLLVPAPTAQAGYVPVQMMQSLGAVETQGIQRDLAVTGLAELVTVGAADLLGDNRRLLVNLAEKNGQKPYLFGDNHLVWKDGEPIDPFILTLLLDDPASDPDPQLVISREVYNQDLPMTDFTPLQRAMSMRGPIGFGFDLTKIPPWAVANLSPVHQKLLASPGALPPQYLAERIGVLLAALTDALAAGTALTKTDVDTIVSYAERLLLVALPRNTTVAWLNVLCNYGHTISGDMAMGSGLGALLTALHQRGKLPLQLETGSDRTAPDSRWLVNYTLGMMDTDALSNVVYGELYIPLKAGNSHEPVALTESWTFPAGLEPALLPLVARFDRVFWTDTAQVTGPTRTWLSPGGNQLTETLLTQTDAGYTYQLTGIAEVSEATGSLDLTPTDTGRLRLTWHLTFRYGAGAGAAAMGRLVGQTRVLMQTAIRQFLAPIKENL